MPYNNICYTINDLSSNHLPELLKFNRVNVTKNELTPYRTDWSVFTDRADGRKIDHNLKNTNTIDYCISEKIFIESMQAVLHLPTT